MGEQGLLLLATRGQTWLYLEECEWRENYTWRRAHKSVRHQYC